MYGVTPPAECAAEKERKKNGDLRKGLYCANKQFLRLRRKDYAFFVRGYRFLLPPSPSRSVSLLLRLRGRPTIVINNASARIAEIKKKKKKQKAKQIQIRHLFRVGTPGAGRETPQTVVRSYGIFLGV